MISLIDKILKMMDFIITQVLQNRYYTKRKNELLRRLFFGKTIMIDNLNISFLHLSANAIEIPELSQIRDISHKSCIKQSNRFIFNYKKK